VALSFLGKWFGGKRPDAAALEEVRAELDRLLVERPAFAEPLRWLRAVLPTLAPADDLRPRDLALLLLASGELSPRQRARDQQADLAGAGLKRCVLAELVARDPEEP